MPAAQRRLGVVATIVIVLIAIVAMLSFTSGLSAIGFDIENVGLSLNPSASHAYALGMRHFSSSNPRDYNIEYAEYFLRRAAGLDPKLPYVHQQLARIDFLHGRFSAAIPEINAEIALQGDKNPSAYYIRGLIQGYQGAYGAAAADYEHFIKLQPSWAGYNDYAWVLLKAKRPHAAIKTLQEGLQQFSGNAWLLNSFATALYDIGDYTEAQQVAVRAVQAAQALSEAQWSSSYPGNDPRIAATGLATFKSATEQNLATIMSAASSTPARK